jgi:acyl carrier protein
MTRNEQQIRSEVLDQLAVHAARPSLRTETDDVDLRECGLDSFTTFEFMLSLEQRFGLSISDELFDARRCRTVNGIVGLLLEVHQRAGDR